MKRTNNALLASCYALLLLFLGCAEQNPTQPSAAAPADSSAATQSAEPVVPSAAEMEALLARRDSLAQRFDLKQQNLPIPSYYHKTWWSSYYIRREALLAGVDSNGVVFLIHVYNCSVPLARDDDADASFRDRSHTCEGGLADLAIVVGDSTYLLQASPHIDSLYWGSPDAIQRDMVISTGYYCSDYFVIPRHITLLERLRDASFSEVYYERLCFDKRVAHRTRLSRKDRAAFQDCAGLGLMIAEIGRGRAAIAQQGAIKDGHPPIAGQ
jgi:hypothetical protein